MTDEEAAAIAADLVQAHIERRPHQRVPAAERSLANAYRVQEAFVAQLSATAGQPVGYKIALTSKAMQALLGLDHPVYGRVLESRVHSSPARLELARYQHVGIEFEVAVKLARALPAGSGAHTRESVAGAVEWCAPAFEIIEDRGADYQAIDAFDLAAENAWNGGIVLGEPCRHFESADLIEGITEFWLDGAHAGRGRAGDALGHPFDAVAWLANQLVSQGRSLEAGALVMTGSSITTRFPAAGDEMRFAVAGLGEVEVAWQ